MGEKSRLIGMGRNRHRMLGYLLNFDECYYIFVLLFFAKAAILPNNSFSILMFIEAFILIYENMIRFLQLNPWTYSPNCETCNLSSGVYNPATDSFRAKL